MDVLIDYRSALRGRSGVGEYVHQLVRALLTAFPPAAGTRPLRLTLFSSSWKDRLQLPGEIRGVRSIDRHVPVSLLNLAWHRFGWPPVELLTRDRFDVTHSLHPLIMPSRGAAHVITIHDLNFLSHPERTRAEIRRDYPRLTREHAQRADRIIVPSQFTAREVERQLQIPADRISVCSPGAPDWTPRPAAVANAATATGYILFFGTLEPRKNVGTLLEAYARLLAAESGAGAAAHRIARLPDLVLAGQATALSKPWLDRIAQPPLAGRVRHIGYVDPDQRRAVYEGARLLVQPSFEEGFGIPVLEAMTLGVPVVAANRGALPEVLGAAGLQVDPEDADQLAMAIRRLLDDHALAAACAAAGVVRSREFQWSATAVRVFDAYELACAARHRRLSCASA